MNCRFIFGPAPILIALMLLGILAVVLLTGCNTFHLPPSPRHPAPPAIQPGEK
jgi:hypothetical protein